MSFANMKEGSTFTPAPSGVHGARLFQAIDLGTQEDNFYGSRRKLLLSFELPGKLMDDGKPFIVSKWSTASLHKKSNFRQCIISWLGRDLTQEERCDFNWDTVKDVPALVSIVHKIRDDGSVRADIQSISPLPEGMTVEPLQGDQIIFDLENFNAEIFESLSDGIKDMIAKSPEYQRRVQAPDSSQSEFIDDNLDSLAI